MTKRMLIDATHAEETRVVVLNGNRLEDFDFETSTKKQLKGNIYLAKVTRVEPSLQAAFVDFGGNRHGFLAFSEIHPDYYQIPVADRMALLKEEEELAAEDDLEEAEELGESGDASSGDGNGARGGNVEGRKAGNGHGDDLGDYEEVGGEDEAEMHEAQRRRAQPKRQRYKIQEVIKRRQIILVQVVKEERGNKGAALTTYLSLAGRYCVLMPNTTRGGGISRKITNPKDRKRLKGFVSDFDIPDGVAVILRTAAVERSKAEIKRDFEFLIRAWNQVRETTLQSIAPTLVYEEGNLIKRTIRDLYSKDIDEVLVEGDEGYKTAKDFMRMLMPSHAKKIQAYKDDSIPMFHRYQVESQIDAMHSPEVQLKSGGYIVINPTEALVSIDVNSGRATRERNIEETAYKTNLEASEEIARQLKLRDLAGLIVIDFIDMAENRNQHTVERRLKEAMRADRARIQIGRISPFGLLELSRQRLRPSLIEASTETCPQCEGTGLVRSTESSALHVLRMVEEEGIRKRSSEILLHVPHDVAFYILNQKRDMLTGIEARHDLRVMVTPDDTLVPPKFRLDRVAERTAEERPEDTDARAAAEAASEEKPSRRRRSRRRPQRHQEAPDESEQAAEAGAEAESAPRVDAEQGTEESAHTQDDASQGADKEKPKRRRRGRRGGRRHSRTKAAGGAPADAAGVAGEDADVPAREQSESPAEEETPEAVTVPAGVDGSDSEGDPEPAAAEAGDAPNRRGKKSGARTAARGRKGRRAKSAGDGKGAAQEGTGGTEDANKPSQRQEADDSPPRTESAAAQPVQGDGNGAGRSNGDGDTGEPPPGEKVPDFPVETEPTEESSEPRRRGWWNRVLP